MGNKTERYSRQKEEIYRILRNTNTHPVAEWIHKQAKRKISRLSLGTVYRNLNHLCQKGEIKKFTFGTQLEHYEGNIKPHQHFVCKRCGRIFDFFLDVNEEILAKTKKLRKFRVEEVEVEFRGTCFDCRMTSK
ncbi:MAG: transcriptional repressor [candidate division Zixibacteria bacterium]|nr:transcriptional repressor [candidate division Zixibacteria bacterium]